MMEVQARSGTGATSYGVTLYYRSRPTADDCAVWTHAPRRATGVKLTNRPPTSAMLDVR
jgi:hypothetical protein